MFGASVLVTGTIVGRDLVKDPGLHRSFGVIAAAGIRMRVEKKVDCTQSRDLIRSSVGWSAG